MELKPNRLKPTEEVIEDLLTRSDTGLGRSFLVYRLSKRWPQVVGKDLGDVSKPVRFEKGTLFVFVKSSAWLQEVTYFKEEILIKLKSLDPQIHIEDVQFLMAKF
jgi:predicted nucleic acid-binding Zn ribbon protein